MFTQTHVIVDDKGYAIARAEINRHLLYKGWWLECVKVKKRFRGQGNGFDLVKIVLRTFSDRPIRLGTGFRNYAMFWLAIKCGFEIEGTDNYGFVMIKRKEKKHE